MFLYKVEDIFAGALGYVTQEKNGILIISSQDIDEIIIFKKKKLKNIKDDYCAINIFTNQQYFFFQGNKNRDKTIKKAINSYAIMSFAPIDMSLTIQKKWITKKELLKLYLDLNPEYAKLLEETKKVNQYKEQIIPQIPITDNILKMILETNNLVKHQELEEIFKNSIIQALEQLAEYYVTSLTQLNQSTIPILALEKNEYQIRMECIRMLAEIDSELKNPHHTKNYTLKKQLNQVKKELNS